MTEMLGCCIERLERPEWEYLHANFVAGSIMTCYIDSEVSGRLPSGKDDQ